MNNKSSNLNNPKPNNNIIRPKSFHSGGDGDDNGNNKYVTHTELDLNNEKILHQIDNRFNETDKHLVKLNTHIESIDKTLNWVVGGVILSVAVQFIIKYIL